MGHRKNLLLFSFVFFLLIGIFGVFKISPFNFKGEIKGIPDLNIPKTSIGGTSNFTTKNFYAIVVGIENYTGDLYDLDFCKDDALDIASYLIASCNVPNENIILLTDQNATVISIDLAFTQINASIKPEDDFLIYFSGHGNVGYFQTYYGVPANSSAYYNYTHLDTVLDGIDCSKKYIIIDACHSGSAISSCSGVNRVIMTSCTDSELCYEASSLQNGIFTYYFIEAHTYSTDANSDDVVSFEEMYSLTYSGARTYSNYLYGSYQNAQLSDGINGESVLYPSIGAVSYVISNVDTLNYQFIIFGTGLIYNSSLIINLDTTEINLNLTNTNTTNNAFGSYSGSIKLNTTEEPNNCTITVFIEGALNKTITHTYIFVTSTPPGSNDEPPLIALGSYYIIYLLGISFLLIVINKKRLKIVRE